MQKDRQSGLKLMVQRRGIVCYLFKTNLVQTAASAVFFRRLI